MQSLPWILMVLFLVVIIGGCKKTPTPETQSKSVDKRSENPLLNIGLGKDKLQFTYTTDTGTDVVDIEKGYVGQATSMEGPRFNVYVRLAWPTPKTCELTVDYDSKGSARVLKISLTGFTDAKATSEGKEMVLPLELHSGSHRAVITAKCP